MHFYIWKCVYSLNIKPSSFERTLLSRIYFESLVPDLDGNYKVLDRFEITRYFSIGRNF